MAAPIPKHSRKYTSPYLSDERSPKVHVVCSVCGMRRRYDTAQLLDRLSEDVCMPDLVRRLAKAEGCDRIGKVAFDVEKPCGLRYDMKAMGRPETTKGPATR